MTQGTQARSTKKPSTTPVASGDLDLDAWMEQRGLAGSKRIKIGGKWFRFVCGATSGQLAVFAEARNQGELVTAMAALLVDPTEAEGLAEAFTTQRQPIAAAVEQEFLTAILNHLINGDAGESSAS